MLAGSARLLYATNDATSDGIQLDRMPAALKVAIDKAKGGGTIKELSKEIHLGKVAYEVEYIKDGRRKEITLTPDGKTIRSTVDADKDE